MINDLTPKKLKELKLKANHARQLLIETLAPAGSGHTGGPLGMTDIFTAFYFHILNHDPKNPDWEERDRLILSNGHICPIRYVAMSMAGYFPIEELKTLRKIDSRLQGHPHRTTLPGLETTSGPLGEGLSQGIGMALARDLDKKNHFIYVLTSDGEHQEGNIWEAAMFAGKLKLQKFIQIIDRNRIQIDGNTEDIMPLDPLKEKYQAFNWNVLEVDGNDIQAFVETIKKAQEMTDKPVFIIANTVPGKGVSFMENNYRWHGVTPDGGEVEGAPPKGKQAQKSLEELKILEEQIKSEA